MRKSLLFVISSIAALLFSGCTTTIYDEPDLWWKSGIELPTKQDGSDIIKSCKVGNTFISFSFKERMDGDVALDGVRLLGFKGKASLGLKDLEPHTHYNLTLRLWDKESIRTYSYDFETLYHYFELEGAQEMDLNYNEVTISKIVVLPNGDMIEQLPQMLRCVDADGKVKWRNYITPDKLNVTSTGSLVAIYQSSVLPIDTESGAVITKYVLPQSFSDACMGEDGTLVVVGSRRIRFEDPESLRSDCYRDEYFIGHYDALGNVLTETYHNLDNQNKLNRLLFVSSLPQGGYIAIGTLAAIRMEVLLLDEDCNIRKRFVRKDGTSIVSNDLIINSVCFDSQGNAYVLGSDTELNEFGRSANTAIVFKLNDSGEIDWLSKFQEYNICIDPVMMKIVDDHCVILLNDFYVVLGLDGTELLKSPLGQFNGSTLNIFPQDSTYTNCLLINKYGNIYRMHTDGYYN